MTKKRQMSNTSKKTTKATPNTFEKFKKNVSAFLEKILEDAPVYIVPVEKKGCKLLRVSQKRISDKIRYRQYFENNDINLKGVKIAIVDDATKYTSMLQKYREFFEEKGAIVSTYSFVGQKLLKTAERHQYDPNAIIFKYLDESTYQEYIIQQSQFLSADENFFDIDHFVIRIKLSSDRYEKLLTALNAIGEIEFTNDVYTPHNIEKVSLFNFNLPSAENLFPPGVTNGSLQKIRFAYNRESDNLTIAPLSFPIWDIEKTNACTLFRMVPFFLPYEMNDNSENDGIYFNICYAFHVHLLKVFLSKFASFSELQSFDIETQNITAYVGSKKVESIVASLKEYLLERQSETAISIEREKIVIPQHKKEPFHSVKEIMDELRKEYEELVHNANDDLRDIRYFLSYEEIISRFQGRANLMKWIDILCDRGVLVARNHESHGKYYRACRSGEADYDHNEEKSCALLPLAINACGNEEKIEQGDFFRINSMYLNKILANLVYDYPKDDYDFHAFFTKPYLFGPLTYLKDQLDNEVDIPLYEAEKISKYCTYDERKKEFVAINLKSQKKFRTKFFGQDDAVSYMEIAAYLQFLKIVRERAGTDDFLNAMAICRDETVFYRHVYFNIKTAYDGIKQARYTHINSRKELFLRDSATNINSAKNKLKYRQDEVINSLKKHSPTEPIYDNTQERILNSFVPFSEDKFVKNTIPLLHCIANIEHMITNLMLFDVSSYDLKYLKQFVKAYKKQHEIVILNFDYYLEVIDNHNKYDWNINDNFEKCKAAVEKTVDELFLCLQQRFGFLQNPSDKNYIMAQRRENRIYATNKASRYIRKNQLNSIAIIYYDFTGYKNIENQKTINVIATVQQLINLRVKEIDALSIFGATGSDERGALIFDSFTTAIKFVDKLWKLILSGELNQISLRMGCAYRNIPVGLDPDELIADALHDAANCSVIETNPYKPNRLLFSKKTQEQLGSYISFIKSIQVESVKQGSSETYYEYGDCVDNEQEEISSSHTDDSVKIGIITVLSDEHTAMRAMITDGKTVSFPGKGAGHQFYIGHIKSFGDGDKHIVALAQTTGDNNNKAAIRAAKLIEHFPNLKLILMVGIAGGTPLISECFIENDQGTIEKHVRLGDIVVSSSIVQYDYKKQYFAESTLKGENLPPSAEMVQAQKTLDGNMSFGKYPWLNYISDANNLLADNFRRPDSSTDILYDFDGKIIAHPIDDKRNSENPYIFSGKIASSNTVLKNPQKRDKLKKEHDVFAVEMEASGIADATWEAGIGYYVVRGISDYCDSHKNNKWHKYASLVAAAYARALIEKLSS
jgi:nucleoside phosphorylase